MIRPVFALILALTPVLYAGVEVDVEAFGKSLGGWKPDTSTVDYDLSGSHYRTYKPETTPTPDGGIFVSVRIDHRRGWLANDDHAVLEVAFGPDGTVVSAQSSLAIQGRTIASDLVRGTAHAGAEVTGIEGAVRIGTDLVADLSSKLLREKIVEAGRVSYPAVLRHNYNLLFQAVTLRTPEPEPAPEPLADASAEPAPEPPPAAPEDPAAPAHPDAAPLEIHRYDDGSKKK